MRGVTSHARLSAVSGAVQRGGAEGSPLGLPIGGTAPTCEARGTAVRLAVLRDELLDSPAVGEPVQRGDHELALAGWMVGRAAQRVGQEPLRIPGLGHDLLQLLNLAPYGVPPPRSRCVQHRCGGVQWQAQPLGDLMNASRRSSSGPYIRRPARRADARTRPRSS